MQNIPNANAVKKKDCEFGNPGFIFMTFITGLVISLPRLIGKFILALLRLSINVILGLIVMLAQIIVLILGLIALSIAMLITVFTHRPRWYIKGI